MKSKNVLETIESLDANGLNEAQKTVLNGVIEDLSKMDERMAKIEKKVDNLEVKVDSIQASVDRIAKLVEVSISQKQSTSKLFAELIRNKWFWFWFIIFTIILGGGSIADLANIVHIGG